MKRKLKIILAALNGSAFLLVLVVAIILTRQALNYPEMSDEATLLTIKAGLYYFISMCFCGLFYEIGSIKEPTNANTNTKQAI